MGPDHEGHEWIANDRDTELDRRAAALTIREAALAESMKTALAILAAAVHRDAISDGRDGAAEKRESDLDLLEFLGPEAKYGVHWPERRHAGLDRAHAKTDREASLADRVALTEALDGATRGQA